MAIPFLAVEISGLATQAYNSGAVNRKFINDVSGALWTKIEDIEGGLELDTPENWTTLTAGTGIGAFEGSIGVSGSTPVTVNVAGYSTISSQAKSAYDWFSESSQSISTKIVSLESFMASGDEYSKAYASAQIAFYDSSHVDHDQTTNFVANEHIDHSTVSITAGNGLTGGGTIASTRDMAVGAGTGIGVNANDIEVLGYATISANAKLGADYVASGNEYSAAYNWYTESSQSISTKLASLESFAASGDEYSSAYASAQLLKEGAFRKVATGYASVADGGTIAHTLGSVPKAVQITPSGAITFAVAYTVDATNITVRISAAGSRVVNWRAEV